MESKNLSTRPTSVNDIPEEILEVIATFLTKEDIDACFNVCQRWCSIFNNDRIWRRCCMYKEQCLKKYYENLLQQEKKEQISLCTWRKYFECQKRLLENLNRGIRRIEKTGIPSQNIRWICHFTDNHGQDWLFTFNSEDSITVWRFTGCKTLFHTKIDEKFHRNGIWLVQDKLLVLYCDYVKVFQFKHPEYDLKLQYRFMFEMDSVLPDTDFVSDDYYALNVNFILVDNLFVGYSADITDIHSAVFHVWDLPSGKKVGKQSVFQQSFVEFVQAKTGKNITQEFIGGLFLSPGSSGQCLVSISNYTHKLCHISLLSLAEKRFINVIAKLECRKVWCLMRDKMVAIYQSHWPMQSRLSLYHTQGQFLTDIDLAFNHNPYFTHRLLFSKDKLILTKNYLIHVFTTKENKDVQKQTFETERDMKILCCFDAKYLFLFEQIDTANTLGLVSVWDIEIGVKLWSLGMIQCNFVFKRLLEHTEYPGNLFVQFKDSEEINVNFEL